MQLFGKWLSQLYDSRPELAAGAALSVLWVFGMTASDAIAQARIMPLGNSITGGTGSSHKGGYRYYLYNSLSSTNFAFDFVGSLQDGRGFDDNDHEGHSGARADELDVRTHLINNHADLVLLEIGTNDVSWGNNADQIRSYIERVIDRIYAFDAAIKIYLSTIIPRRDYGWRQAVNDEVNASLPGLMSQKTAEGFTIYLVDIASRFKNIPDWHYNLMFDDIHPNDAGYAVMAQAWLDALLGAEPSDNTPSYVQRVNAGGSSYTSNGKAWEADQAYTHGSWGYQDGHSYVGSDRIAGTTDDVLYKSERWGLEAYRFAVPGNGRYRVVLHFAELVFTKPGERVFDVYVEDELGLNNLDIYAAVGHDAALIHTFEARVSDGVLDISFGPIIDNPKISAIEVFAVLPSAQSILRIASPNGGEQLFANRSHEIKWSAWGSFTDLALAFSVDGGASWRTIVESTPNDGSYNWLVPNFASNSCVVRISDAADGYPADESDASFSIVSAGGPGQLLPDLRQWAGPLPGGMLDAEIVSEEGETRLRFSSSTVNLGDGPLDVRGVVNSVGILPAYQRIYFTGGGYQDILVGEFGFAGHEDHNHFHFKDFVVYRLRKVNADGSLGPVVASSDKILFCLRDSDPYDLTFPNAEQQSVYTCDQQGISVGWASRYDRDTRGQWIVLNNVPDGEYWLETETNPDRLLYEKNYANNLARIRIALNKTKRTVTILPNAIAIASPNGGERWVVGSAQEIKWSAISTLANVRLEFSADGGKSWTTIVASTANDGSHSWKLPDTISNQCLVRVSDAADGNPADVSDAVFAIVASTFSFAPLHDAYVRLSAPAKNYGSTTALLQQFSSSEIIRAYLKFDVNGLDGAVLNATLRLYVTNASNDGGSVYLVSSNYNDSNTAWAEGSLIWNNAPAIGGAALSAAGVVHGESWIELDVTPAIVGNGIYSFGLKNTSSNAAGFNSKEGTNAPELIVRTKPNLPQGPTIVSFAPLSGKVGTEVTINGSNFVGVSEVAFNGARAIAFTVDSPAQIRAKVPPGAGTGKISVANSAGTGLSAVEFEVIPAPPY
jgi:lysophospholipase L1-like esterase